MYLTSMAFGVDYVQGHARGLYAGLSAFRERMIEGAPHFHLVARGLTALLGTVTVLAAVVGLYGVMSYLVAQRTREFGIRIALGAKLRDMLKLIVGHGMKLVALPMIYPRN